MYYASARWMKFDSTPRPVEVCKTARPFSGTTLAEQGPISGNQPEIVEELWAKVGDGVKG
jgi:hypothetical protein